MDAIGEWDTVSISKGYNQKCIERMESIKYPHSLGILYSAFTERCGLKPAEEEYILMGMAAYGTPKYKDDIYKDFVKRNPFRMKRNLHKGIGDWHPEADVMDLAASVQAVTEECLTDLWIRASKYAGFGNKNLVYAGGVALNCVANGKLLEEKIFDNIFITIFFIRIIKIYLCIKFQTIICKNFSQSTKKTLPESCPDHH